MKYMMTAIVTVAVVAAYGDQGFLSSKFGKSYDGESNLWCSTNVVPETEMAYRHGYGLHNTTFGYAAYMNLKAGIKYRFMSNYDDFGTIKIDGKIVVDDKQFGSRGEFEAEFSGYHAVEVRLGNMRGYYGYDPNNYHDGFMLGVYYSEDDGKTWKKFCKSIEGDIPVFVTKVPEESRVAISSFGGVVVTMKRGAEQVDGFVAWLDKKIDVPSVKCTTKNGEALYDVATGKRMSGRMPRETENSVQVWIGLRREQLVSCWKRLQSDGGIVPVAPLQ